jgi:4-hydroxybenzoate polyprenyltransferase
MAVKLERYMKVKLRWILLLWAALFALAYGASTIWHPSLEVKLLILFFVAMLAAGYLADKLDRIERKLDAISKR